MLREYNAKDISTCLKSRKIVYAGDSTVRQIFWATAAKLDVKGADEARNNAAKHEDLTFSRAEVTLEFIWDPFLNTSNLHQHLAARRDGQVARKNEDKGGNKSAATLLIGGGLWHAQHYGEGSLQAFENSFDIITSLMNHGDHGVSSQVFPPSASNRPSPDYPVVFAPVQIPWYDSLSPDRAATLTAVKIDPLNEYLQELSAQRGALVAWSYFLMTLQRKSAFEASGVHVVDTVARRKADVLLNMRCNAELTRATKYPVDKTCCSSYVQTNWVQRIILFSSLGTLPLMVWFTSGGMYSLACGLRRQSPNLRKRFQATAMATIRKAISCSLYFRVSVMLLLLRRPYADFQQIAEAIFVE